MAGPDLPIGLAVAIIMDGNGRWAQKRDLSVTEGHRAGGRALRRTVEESLDLSIAELTVYAFSTENWTRDPAEVTGLMELFHELLTTETPDLHQQGVRMRFIGRREGLPTNLVERMRTSEDLTSDNTAMTLTIAFNYGGRAEIVDAARAVAAEQGANAISEESIAAALYEPQLRDPDIIIRTAGEQRTSNFLIWQGAYSELVFVDTFWPDFGRGDLLVALSEFSNRERRFGGREAKAVETGVAP